MKNKISEYISLSKIVPDENQPRKYFAPEKLATLKDSVKRFGILNPLTVEKVGDKYLLVDGERRYKTAKDLGLKDVPVIVTEPRNEIERLIEQFHLQEQHEGWNPAEKAMTIHKLAIELGVGMTEAYKLLGINSRTAAVYMSFAHIIDKENFMKNEVSIFFAQSINNLRRTAKKISVEKLNKSFTRTDEKTLERVMVNKLKSGEINKGSEIVKIKDAIIKDPNMIAELLKGKMSADDMYVKSKAQGATNLRRLKVSAAYFGSYVNKFLSQPDVEVTEEVLVDVKYAKKAAADFLARFGE